MKSQLNLYYNQSMLSQLNLYYNQSMLSQFNLYLMQSKRITTTSELHLPVPHCLLPALPVVELVVYTSEQGFYCNTHLEHLEM